MFLINIVNICKQDFLKFLTQKDFRNLSSCIPTAQLRTFCKHSREFYTFRFWVAEYILKRNKRFKKSLRLWYEIDFLTRQIISGRRTVEEFKRHMKIPKNRIDSITEFPSVNFTNTYNMGKTLAFRDEVYWISFYTNTIVTHYGIHDFSKIHKQKIEDMRKEYLEGTEDWPFIVSKQLQKDI